MYLLKILLGLLCFQKDNKCLSCKHYSNEKCFFYRVLLNTYIIDLASQIDDQKFATEKDALSAEEARAHIYLCGPDAIHYMEKK